MVVKDREALDVDVVDDDVGYAQGYIVRIHAHIYLSSLLSLFFYLLKKINTSLQHV